METERESQLLHCLAQNYFASIEQSSLSRIKQLLVINHEEANSEVPRTMASPECNTNIANIHQFDELIFSDSVELESTPEQTVASPFRCSTENLDEEVSVKDSLGSEEMNFSTIPGEDQQQIDLINDSPANDENKDNALMDSLSEMQDSLEFEVMGRQGVEEIKMQDTPCRENCRYGQNEPSESPSLRLQNPITISDELPVNLGHHDSPPPSDTYEVLSERLIIASSSFDCNAIESGQTDDQDKEDGYDETDETSKENTATTQEAAKGSRNKKGKRVDIIARNKRNLGNMKSQGSYTKHRNRTLHAVTQKTPNLQSQSYEPQCDDNCGKRTTESLNSDFDQGPNFNRLSQLCHMPPLPPIGEPAHSINAVQSAPADLYKLSYLIQEERKKLMDAGVLTPLYHDTLPHHQDTRNSFLNDPLRNSHSVPKVPHQSPVSDHFLNAQGHQQQVRYGNWFSNTQHFTSTGDPLNMKDLPISQRNQMHTNSLGIRQVKQSTTSIQQGGYLEMKKSYAKKQKEYADIVKRQPHKAKFSLPPTKASSADYVKESKRLVALNYSKSIPKPIKSAKKIPSEAKAVPKTERNHDNVLEIMKQRHESEKKEVERLRRELSVKLRSGR